MSEAAAVLKALDLQEQEEHELLGKIEHELERVRGRGEVSKISPVPNEERDGEWEDE